jgi:drug/metabolite transporter (DMT)-like permease
MPYLEKYKEAIGAALVFVGAVLFSGKAVLVKLAYGYQVDPVALLSMRMLFALPFFLVIAFFSGRRAEQVQLNQRDWLAVLALGIVGYYLASLFDFLGLQYISAGLERLILFVYPTLVVVLSAIFYGIKIGKREYRALLLTYLGIFVVFYHDLSLNQSGVVIGSLLIFASAFTYAIYLMGSGRLIPKLGSVRFTAYAMIVSSVAVLAHYAVIHGFARWDFPAEVYILGLIMAVFATVLPAFLLSEGIRLIGSGRASIVGSVGPVSTIVLAYMFLNESITMYQLLGTALVLVGVLTVSAKDKVIPNKKEQEPVKA